MPPAFMAMSLSRLFYRKPDSSPAWKLYDSIVAQARQPALYAQAGVPDSVDGRFELIMLHAFVVLRRLKAEHGMTKELAQALFDRMFDDMDRSLREMGAGDLGVGRRVKAMATAFYGRINAYEGGLAADDAALYSVLIRNLYGTVEADPGSVEKMVHYLRRQIAQLDSQTLERLMVGEVEFSPALTQSDTGEG